MPQSIVSWLIVGSLAKRVIDSEWWMQSWSIFWLKSFRSNVADWAAPDLGAGGGFLNRNCKLYLMAAAVVSPLCFHPLRPESHCHSSANEGPQICSQTDRKRDKNEDKNDNKTQTGWLAEPLWRSDNPFINEYNHSFIQLWLCLKPGRCH